jgi:hypothetical protein
LTSRRSAAISPISRAISESAKRDNGSVDDI